MRVNAEIWGRNLSFGDLESERRSGVCPFSTARSNGGLGEEETQSLTIFRFISMYNAQRAFVTLINGIHIFPFWRSA